MKRRYKVGDWVYITGSRQINQDYWNKHFPRGIFGRVIISEKRYNCIDGKRLLDKIVVRTYRPKGEKPHYNANYKYLKLFNQNTK